MVSMTKTAEVQRAVEEVRQQTLARIPRPLDRLIYLASMRDDNTGVYHHEGLASRFPRDIACEALANCHREVYEQLISCPLENLVEQMESYREATGTSPREFLSAWKDRQPYRVAVPMQSDGLATEFLFSNFTIALAIMEERLPVRRCSQELA